MASNQAWQDDENLKDDMNSYVAQNFKRKEILDFVRRDYVQYDWSLPTLARRLKKFEIKYINYTTNIETVREAINGELNGPGKLLGYRAMNLKLRTEHNIKVPRHLVHSVMQEVDPEGLEERSVRKKKRKSLLLQMDRYGWYLWMDMINCMVIKTGLFL